jgi:hypothetical protein
MALKARATTLISSQKVALLLRDQVVFDKVFISFGVPSWPNGFDVDAINLQMEIREQGGLGHAAA